MEYMAPIPSLSPTERMRESNGYTNMSQSSRGPSRFDLDQLRKNTTNDTQAPVLLSLGGSLLFLSMLLLVARLWSRLRPVSKLHYDDWLVLGGTILATIQFSLLAASCAYGLGRHGIFVSFPSQRISLELLFISQVIWYWSITLVKLSVAFLLLRVKSSARNSGRHWKFFLYCLIGLSVLAAVVQTLFQFLQCRPFSVYWDPRVFRAGSVRCFKRSIINGNIVAFSSIQVGLDLVFSFIPITFIRKLNRPRREKIFMCVLMGLGLFASFAAIVRTLILQYFYTSPDIFRTNVMIAIWAVLEQQLALIAATIPTLKAFMEKSLVRIGLFFYDEGTETQVRNRLVAFGLLGEGEKLDEEERRPSKGTANTDTVSSPVRDKKIRDEFGETIIDTKNDKDLEEMLSKSARPPT